MTNGLRSTWVIVGSLAAVALAAAGCPGTGTNSCQNDSECFEGEVCYDTRCIDREDLPESDGDAADSSTDVDGGTDDAQVPDGDDGGSDVGDAGDAGEEDVRECDGSPVTWYRDGDKDGFGKDEDGESCSEAKLPDGSEADGENDEYALQSGDCNDDAARVNPGMDEICGDDFENNDCDPETKCSVVVGRGEDVSVHFTDAVVVPDRGYLVVGARQADVDSDGTRETRAFATLYDFEFRRLGSHDFEPVSGTSANYATTVHLLPEASGATVAVGLYGVGNQTLSVVALRNLREETGEDLFQSSSSRTEPFEGGPYLDITGPSPEQFFASYETGGDAYADALGVDGEGPVEGKIPAEGSGEPRLAGKGDEVVAGFIYRGSNALDLPSDGKGRVAAARGEENSSSNNPSVEFFDAEVMPPSGESEFAKPRLVGWVDPLDGEVGFHTLISGGRLYFLGAGMVSNEGITPVEPLELARGTAPGGALAIGSGYQGVRGLAAGSGEIMWPSSSENQVSNGGVVGMTYGVDTGGIERRTAPTVFFDPPGDASSLGVVATAVSLENAEAGAVFGTEIRDRPWTSDEFANWSYLSRRHLDQLPQAGERQ